MRSEQTHRGRRAGSWGVEGPRGLQYGCWLRPLPANPGAQAGAAAAPRGLALREERRRRNRSSQSAVTWAEHAGLAASGWIPCLAPPPPNHSLLLPHYFTLIVSKRWVKVGSEDAAAIETA